MTEQNKTMSDMPILPDGSSFFVATIYSDKEVAEMPLKYRPLNHRIPEGVYTAVWESVGTASLCWEPKPNSEQVFDSTQASKVAVDLCFKIAEHFDSLKTELAHQTDMASQADIACRLANERLKQLQEVARDMRRQMSHVGYSAIIECKSYDSLPPEVKGKE